MLYKVPQTEWLKKQTFISHSSEAGKSKFKAPGESTLAGLQTALFLLYPHKEEKRPGGGEGGGGGGRGKEREGENTGLFLFL